jgi:hypothetical protein
VPIVEQSGLGGFFAHDGNRLADLRFPVTVREKLVVAGKAESHHVLPESAWVAGTPGLLQRWG